MIDHGANAHQLLWFPVQKDAKDRSEAQGGMFIFSRDKQRGHIKGTEPTKEFATCSLTVIHKYMYSREHAQQRNVYEILRDSYPDGSPVPSKLHVDVDINEADCDDFAERGRRFHAAFLPDLREFLAATVDSDFADEAKTPMLCMDSTTPTKFSMHYVMGGIMFTRNWHVGALMRRFCLHVIEKYGAPEVSDNPYFFHSKRAKFIVDGRSATFAIDLGIYTTNRAFRMLGNCKFTKNNMLIPEGMDRAQQYSRKFTLQELLNSIVQDPVLAEKCKIYSMTEPDGTEARSRSVSRVRIFATPLSTGPAARLLERTPDAGQRAKSQSTEQVVIVPPKTAEAFCRLLHELHPQVSLAPGNVKYKPLEGKFIVPHARNSFYCFTACRNHTTAPNFFVVSCMDGTYNQLCLKTGCNASANPHKPWPMPPAMRAIADEYLAKPACSGSPGIGLASVFGMVSDVEQMIPEGYVGTQEINDAPDDIMECLAMDLPPSQ